MWMAERGQGLSFGFKEWPRPHLLPSFLTRGMQIILPTKFQGYRENYECLGAFKMAQKLKVSAASPITLG